MPNTVENGEELSVIEDEMEPLTTKTTRLELLETLNYEEIDRFILALEDPEDIRAGRNHNTCRQGLKHQMCLIQAIICLPRPP